MQPPAHPQRRRPILIALACLVILVTVGVVVTVKLLSSGANSELGRLKSVLDRVPLPPGAMLLTEDAQPASDAEASVYRSYQLPTAAVSVEIVTALKDAGYRTVNPITGVAEPRQWQQVTKPDDGTLSIQPPGGSGRGGIQITWSGRNFDLSAGSSDIA